MGRHSLKYGVTFERDRGIEQGDVRRQLEDIAFVMRVRQGVRIRLELESTRESRGERPTRFAGQTAEQMIRFLVEGGVDRTRIDAGTARDLVTSCAESDRECQLRSHRVRVTLIR